MELLVNLLIVVSPAVMLMAGVILAYFTAEKVFKYKPFKFSKILSFAFTLFMLVGVYLVTTSPILRPVSVVHDKKQELSVLKKEVQDIQVVKPGLKDNSFDDEIEDASDTPLFDQAMQNIKEVK